MGEEHFTAWLGTDPGTVIGSTCDVIVLADKTNGYVHQNGFETDEPIWTPTGSPLFTAFTNVSVYDGDPQEAMDQAKALLKLGGWETRGEWDAVDTGCTIEVVRGD